MRIDLMNWIRKFGFPSMYSLKKTKGTVCRKEWRPFCILHSSLSSHCWSINLKYFQTLLLDICILERKSLDKTHRCKCDHSNSKLRTCFGEGGGENCRPNENIGHGSDHFRWKRLNLWPCSQSCNVQSPCVHWPHPCWQDWQRWHSPGMIGPARSCDFNKGLWLV